MSFDKVEGAIDKSRLSVKPNTEFLLGTSLCIFYDNVPLWRTADGNLDNLDIFLYDPTKFREENEDEPYSIICVDSYGDAYTYGNWKTLEEAKEWLANPKILY